MLYFKFRKTITRLNWELYLFAMAAMHVYHRELGIYMQMCRKDWPARYQKTNTVPLYDLHKRRDSRVKDCSNSPQRPQWPTQTLITSLHR